MVSTSFANKCGKTCEGIVVVHSQGYIHIYQSVAGEGLIKIKQIDTPMCIANGY